jgi:hypothetical protein
MGMLIFAEERKPENPEKNPSNQGDSTHILCLFQESNPHYSVERRVISPLRHPYFPLFTVDITGDNLP